MLRMKIIIYVRRFSIIYQMKKQKLYDPVENPNIITIIKMLEYELNNKESKYYNENNWKKFVVFIKNLLNDRVKYLLSVKFGNPTKEDRMFVLKNPEYFGLNENLNSEINIEALSKYIKVELAIADGKAKIEDHRKALIKMESVMGQENYRKIFEISHAVGSCLIEFENQSRGLKMIECLYKFDTELNKFKDPINILSIEFLNINNDYLLNILKNIGTMDVPE